MAKDSKSSQKFIARNRPPRVQIEYDLETNDSMKKVEIPFVVGVLADLSGASSPDAPESEEMSEEEWKAVDIDMDNFNEKLKQIKPSLVIGVPNVLGKVDDQEPSSTLTFEIEFSSMRDFSPGAIARNVPALKKLLDARNHLSNLKSYMDGRTAAEKYIKDLLNDKKQDRLKNLVEARKQSK